MSLDWNISFTSLNSLSLTAAPEFLKSSMEILSISGALFILIFSNALIYSSFKISVYYVSILSLFWIIVYIYIYMYYSC